MREIYEDSALSAIWVETNEGYPESVGVSCLAAVSGI